MDLGQWQEISGRLVGLFPQAPLDERTFGAYFDELRSFDADIVEAAIRAHSHVSKWFPSIAELYQLVQPEQAVRSEVERLPDFTGFAKLTEPEQVARLDAGLAASRGIEGVPQRGREAPWHERIRAALESGRVPEASDGRDAGRGDVG